MRRLEFSDEFAFSDGKPIRSPQDLGDRLVAEPLLEVEAWQRVDDGSLERWLHDTGWEEPARHVAQIRKQKGPRVLADLLRLLQGKAPVQAPTGPQTHPAPSEPVPSQAKPAQPVAVPRAPAAAAPPVVVPAMPRAVEAPTEAPAPLAESGLLERQRQAIRTFREAEAALGSVTEEEARQVEAEEQEVREEAEARRAEAEQLWLKAQAIQTKARDLAESVALESISATKAVEPPAREGGQTKPGDGILKTIFLLPYVLIGLVALAAGGVGIFYVHEYLTSGSDASPPKGTNQDQMMKKIRNVVMPPPPPPEPKISEDLNVRLANLRERLNSADELRQSQRHAEALALLGGIGAADRSRLASLGVDVAKMEARIRQEQAASERPKEEQLVERLNLAETRRSAGDLGRALDVYRQIKAEFAAGLVGKYVNIEKKIQELESLQTEESRLRQKLAQVEGLIAARDLTQALALCKQIKALVEADLVHKHGDIEKRLQELERQIAEAVRWDNGFDCPVDVKSGWRPYRLFCAYDPQLKGYHPGVDLALPDRLAAGKPVHAAGAGTIDKIRPLANGLGSLIVLSHTARDRTSFTVPVTSRDPGWLYGQREDPIAKVYTVYAHVVPWPNCREGQEVKGGDPIASVSDLPPPHYPHLHFEVRHPRTEGLFSEDGVMVYAKVQAAPSPSTAPTAPPRGRTSSGSVKDPATWIKFGGDVAKALSGKGQEPSASPASPPTAGVGLLSSENWVIINGGAAGYYKNLQQMINAGLIHPTAFIKANPADR